MRSERTQGGRPGPPESRPTGEPPRVLLLFLDGVGIGLPDPDRNPFLRAELPVLAGLLGGTLPTLDDPSPGSQAARAFPLDASLGMEGLPRSGTGHTALLTGADAPRLFGRHFGPWVPSSLRTFLEQENVLAKAKERGSRVAFANAYPRRFLDAPLRRWAGPPLAARGAGVLDRHEEALVAGEAVASEIVNTGWRHRLGLLAAPDLGPREAGGVLARIVHAHDLTLFAHYSTDLVGHRGGMTGGVEALERVDAFLGGLLASLAGDTLILVASDHGNLEDVTAGHTLNPALGIAVRAGGREPLPDVSGLRSIRDVPASLLAWSAPRAASVVPPLHQEASIHGT
jgi:2,3-bisphosphoglycerate-independent phosphoglycerate mutase